MENSIAFVLEQIGRQSKDVYFVFDITQGRLIYLSPAFENIWGIDPQFVLPDPTTVLDSINPEDRQHATNHVLDCLQDRIAARFEFRITCQDGSNKHLKANLYPVINNNNVLFLTGNVEDITLVKSNILYAEKINARKDTILDIMAHDLKGPIGVINMMACSIQREQQVAGNESILQSVKYIQQLCQRNIALIRDLMNQEFLESAEVKLRKERADLVWEIKDVIHHYNKSADVLSRKFVVTSDNEKMWVQIDSLKLMQVFNNLISNAIKFTANDGIIEIDIRDKGPQLQITIKDNGIGIPKHMQPYLFDKFTRARRTGLGGEEPVGLGMSIIKTIVELHGGTIRVESEENQGTEFYLVIPKD